jgi:Arc/MetJ family transcription regulator
MVSISDPVRQSLRYVKVPDGAVELTYFPDFLIVGPQRTGTTWLHAHLRYHPEIMLAEPKELFFFSSLKTPDSARFRSDRLDWYLQFFREPLWRVLARQTISLWRYRRPYRPTVRGEATASYACLDRDVIREITALKPEVKVILMIRNPIDRAWSHAKKDLARNRGRTLADCSDSEFQRFFTDPYQRQCARYTENIDNWCAHLRPRHLLLGLFDDVDARPEALLLEVMSFLGVSSDRRYVSNAVREAVNPTAASRIPGHYRAFLEELLQADIAHLEERFGLSWSARQSGTQLGPPVVRNADKRIVFALHEASPC